VYGRNSAALVCWTMTTKPTFGAEFKPGEGGKSAVYMLRWVSTRGTPGPWSDSPARRWRRSQLAWA